jgi:tagatose 1,6-diphosphate aldolase GatY/KbaY
MIDASAQGLDDNIAATRTTLELCRRIEAGVEAELGPGVEDDLVVTEDQAAAVEIDTVRAFISAVRPDALAVAVGTAHGFYNDKPRINFNLIAEMRAEDLPPLVLHGCSGLSDDSIRQAVDAGISKMNFATELRHACVTAITEVATHGTHRNGSFKTQSASVVETCELFPQK